MANQKQEPDDLLTNSEAKPDAGDVTPPHGDEIANEERNASRRTSPSPDDPDSDRPAR